jgi:putative ABC transport system substrate-binding protein
MMPAGKENRMHRRSLLAALGFALVAPLAARAQQPRFHRIGVVFQGGPYAAALDGLRDGLKDLRMLESRDFVLHVRDVKGDRRAVETAARTLEAEKVDVIYAVGTSIALAVKQATKSVPIVFYAGTDPVGIGLVAGFRKPGGRLTGVHSRLNDLTAKRLELLKVLMPKLARVVTFYDPDNAVSMRSIRSARDASRRIGVELIERKVASVDELRKGLQALQPGQADALLYASDGMVISQSAMVIEAASAKKLPIMLSQQALVEKGALASYGVSYYVCGRIAARYIERILRGANPGELAIEQLDTPHLVINLKAAQRLGLGIPESVLARADEVIR